MPPFRLSSLQEQLVTHGFLDERAVVEGGRLEDLTDEVVAAVRVAGESTGFQVIQDRIDERDLERLGEILSRNYCGVVEPAVGIRPQAAGAPGGERWTRGTLNVSINVAGCNFNPVPAPLPPNMATPAAVIMTAFGQWQAVSNYFSFNFVPIGSGEDIQVVFGGQNLDPRFGRAGGVAGSGGYPPGGNLSLDAAEVWTPAFLLNVALHEIGHVLGLSHSSGPNSLMNPFVPPTGVIDGESADALNGIYGWQRQQWLADRGTSHRPTLGITSAANFLDRIEFLHMVWKGVGDDSTIYHSMLEDRWTDQSVVPDVGCSFSPSLAQVSDPGAAVPTTGLIMAWKGVGDDQGIYWTRRLGGGWEGQRLMADVGTSAAPALANVAGRVVIAWKGVAGDGGIYWSTYDGAEGWAPQALVRGVGTTDSPALVGLGSVLFMFWKGVEGDSNAYWSSYDFVNDPIWRPQRRIEYFDYETGGGVSVAIGTTGGLSATVRQGRILLAWKGVEGDQSIWFSLFENEEFSGQTRVADVGTSIGPTVATANDLTYMAWKGVEDDSGIYWSVM